MPDRYLSLNDDVGIDADGNPEPLHEVGAAVSIPTIKDGEVVSRDERVTVKPIAATRILKLDEPRIVESLLSTGHWHEIDPPAKTDLDKQRSDTQDARDAAGTREEN